MACALCSLRDWTDGCSFAVVCGGDASRRGAARRLFVSPLRLYDEYSFKHITPISFRVQSMSTPFLRDV